jgi:hypothetical protein
VKNEKTWMTSKNGIPYNQHTAPIIDDTTMFPYFPPLFQRLSIQKKRQRKGIEEREKKLLPDQTLCCCCYFFSPYFPINEMIFASSSSLSLFLCSICCFMYVIGLLALENLFLRSQVSLS